MKAWFYFLAAGFIKEYFYCLRLATFTKANMKPLLFSIHSHPSFNKKCVIQWHGLYLLHSSLVTWFESYEAYFPFCEPRLLKAHFIWSLLLRWYRLRGWGWGGSKWRGQRYLPMSWHDFFLGVSVTFLSSVPWIGVFFFPLLILPLFFRSYIYFWQ